MLTSLASLQRGNVKKSQKSIKIVNIDGENLSLENTFLEKLQGGSNWPSPAFLGSNFNAYLMHSRMEDRIISLNYLRTASTKILLEQMCMNKIWIRSLINPHLIWRSSFQNMFVSRCYVTFLVANNITLSTLMAQNLRIAFEAWT